MKVGDLSVMGYTCDLGSKARNDVLAMKRAEAVAAYLRKSGLHALRVSGTGKCCYATKNLRKPYLNRRVEVTISKREAAK
jgi:outer membrane protein OmpA-like peptidoglycan-associated protein